MGAKPYPAYRDSGVAWIGEIPEHWEVKRLKDACVQSALYGANIAATDYVQDGVRFLRTTDITDNGNLLASGVYVPKSLALDYMLQTGDILISRSGTVGRALLFNKNHHGECSYAGYLVRFVPGRSLYPRFFFLFTKSAIFGDFLKLTAISSTIENVNGEKYANCAFPSPPLEEQKQIAAFLDAETSKIDTLIGKQQQLINLLKEKRGSLISTTVTKGLNPNAPMKDSGVEWIGEIPEHWELKRLKQFSTLQRGYDLPSHARSAGSIPVIGSGGEIGFHNEAKANGPGIVTGRFGTIGIHYFVLKPFFPHNTSLFVTSFYGNHPLFVWYVFHTIDFKSYSVKTAIPGVDRNDIHPLWIAAPPLEEQKQIASFLDAETSKIDTLIEKANQSIALLKERRSSLISAAVTGKIDVREAV